MTSGAKHPSLSEGFHINKVYSICSLRPVKKRKYTALLCAVKIGLFSSFSNPISEKQDLVIWYTDSACVGTTAWLKIVYLHNIPPRCSRNSIFLSRALFSCRAFALWSLVTSLRAPVIPLSPIRYTFLAFHSKARSCSSSNKPTIHPTRRIRMSFLLLPWPRWAPQLEREKRLEHKRWKIRGTGRGKPPFSAGENHMERERGRDSREEHGISQRQGEIISNRQADPVGRQPQAMCFLMQSKQ